MGIGVGVGIGAGVGDGFWFGELPPNSDTSGTGVAVGVVSARIPQSGYFNPHPSSSAGHVATPGNGVTILSNQFGPVGVGVAGLGVVSAVAVAAASAYIVANAFAVAIAGSGAVRSAVAISLAQAVAAALGLSCITTSAINLDFKSDVAVFSTWAVASARAVATRATIFSNEVGVGVRVGVGVGAHGSSGEWSGCNLVVGVAVGHDPPVGVEVGVGGHPGSNGMLRRFVAARDVSQPLLGVAVGGAGAGVLVGDAFRRGTSRVTGVLVGVAVGGFGVAVGFRRFGIFMHSHSTPSNIHLPLQVGLGVGLMRVGVGVAVGLTRVGRAVGLTRVGGGGVGRARVGATVGGF